MVGWESCPVGRSISNTVCGYVGNIVCTCIMYCINYPGWCTVHLVYSLSCDDDKDYKCQELAEKAIQIRTEHSD